MSVTNIFSFLKSERSKLLLVGRRTGLNFVMAILDRKSLNTEDSVDQDQTRTHRQTSCKSGDPLFNSPAMTSTDFKALKPKS